MKLLFIGLGSIGKRHFRDTSAELDSRGADYSIDVLRYGSTPLEPEIATKINRAYTGYDQLEDEYDVVFIANPSSEHYGTLQKINSFAKAFFIEKPVFTDLDADISKLGLSQDKVYYVACPLRFSPVIIKLKELLVAQKPSAVRAICSSYLPEWRKGTDYRDSYSADIKKGGGVRLDLIHEWDYLSDLFGTPLSVKSYGGHYSKLEIQSEDTAVYIAEYSDMLLTLQLDYTGRVSRREIELFCERDTIIADILKNKICFLKQNKSEYLTPEDIHRAEISWFFDLLEGKTKNNNPIEHAVKTLHLALEQGDGTNE